MAVTSEPRLLTWAIPTPHGLWYRAIVVIDRGIFVTPKVDVTTLDSARAAAATDAAELIENLTGHGRFKRPQFLAWKSITGIRSNASTGAIDIECGEQTVSVTIPDRERLEKLGRVLTKTWNIQTTAS